MNVLFNYTNKIGYNNNNNTDCNCNKSNTKITTKINNNNNNNNMHSKTSFLQNNLNMKESKNDFPNVINIFPNIIIKNKTIIR